MPQSISAVELAQWLAEDQRVKPVLLDVREINELQVCQIPESIHIPMYTVPGRIEELDPERAVVCICHHGARSMKIANFLKQNGFENVINLTGGIHAWATLVDPTMDTY